MRHNKCDMQMHIRAIGPVVMHLHNCFRLENPKIVQNIVYKCLKVLTLPIKLI